MSKYRSARTPFCRQRPLSPWPGAADQGWGSSGGQHGGRPVKRRFERSGSSSVAGATVQGSSSATSNSFVAPASIPFPVAVCDTWVYQTTVANINEKNSVTTNKDRLGRANLGRIPGHDVPNHRRRRFRRLPCSPFTSSPSANALPSGTLVPCASGVLIMGGALVVLWPDAAGLASGQVYHSVLRVGVNQADSRPRYENAERHRRGGRDWPP